MKLLFVLLILSHNIYAFNLNGSALATYDDATIFVHVGDNQCANFTDSPEDLMSMVREGFSKYWNSISTSELHLKDGSIKNVDGTFYTDQICNTGAGCVPPVDSGILIVCNDNGLTFSSSGRLAVALPNNIQGATIKGCVIALNAIATSKFITSSRESKVSTIAHEIGHCIGLGHSNYEDSLMYQKTIGKRFKLGRDDWDGATFLYPKDQGPAAICGTIQDVNNDNDSNNKNLPLSMIAMLLIFLAINMKTNKFT